MLIVITNFIDVIGRLRSRGRVPSKARSRRGVRRRPARPPAVVLRAFAVLRRALEPVPGREGDRTLALVGVGYEFEILELTAGLRIALEVPDAAEQWLAGKDVFRDASLPPSDPESVALHPWTPTFDVPTT